MSHVFLLLRLPPSLLPSLAFPQAPPRSPALSKPVPNTEEASLGSALLPLLPLLPLPLPLPPPRPPRGDLPVSGPPSSGGFYCGFPPRGCGSVKFALPRHLLGSREGGKKAWKQKWGKMCEYGQWCRCHCCCCYCCYCNGGYCCLGWPGWGKPRGDFPL